jgi:UDP-N-acetylmuramoyl-tripeptide--D-alanyl-D-alanine ligase
MDQYRWHLTDVLAATGGRLVRLDGPRRYDAVCTDTRRLRDGEIFLALRGPNHDGHAFVREAIGRGAAALVVENGRAGEVPSDAAVTVIEVEDTLRSYGELAAHHRHRCRLKVAAVTGSNGKTTTKEMIASILGAAVGTERVLKTTGTENNLVGVPLTLLRARGTERLAVLEMGMNAPGEIWRLAEIADPDVGVVTCVAPAHIAGLGSVEGVARAKGELFRRLRPTAVAVVNDDDPHVRPLADGFAGRTVRFGAGTGFRAEGVRPLEAAGVAFTLIMNGTRLDLRLPLPGVHNVSNALAAAAVARELGVSGDAIVAGLENLPPLPMRMQVETLPGSVTVINDAYNANPASMRSALALLAELRGEPRIAVLGAMRELGEASPELHREVGRAAAAAGLATLVVVGAEAEPIAVGARDAGMPASAVREVASQSAAAAVVRELVRPGACVLVKGSRGARMEEVVTHLREGT